MRIRDASRNIDRILILAVAALIVIAAIEVSSTWKVFSPTVDEPFHIAAGMQWLDKGSYSYGLENPPLARAVIAIGPYLKGLRSFSKSNGDDEGIAILYSTRDSMANLAAARSGNLPFLVLACFVVFLWARRWFGRSAAFWSVLLFVSLPPILGHAGLATLDMASAATVITALYIFMLCLENPTTARLVLLGASLALAVLCKFSSIAFLGASLLFTGLYFTIRARSKLTPSFSWRRIRAQSAIVGTVIVICLWAGYRFSLTPLEAHSGGPAITGIDRTIDGMPILRNLAYRAVRTPIPLTEFMRGIQNLTFHNTSGSEGYLFGRYSRSGFWYFFPVVLAVKTPIGFLILAVGGILALLSKFRTRTWQQGLTVVFPFAILLIGMAARINLGVRHILAIYPFLAVIAGFSMSELIRAARTTRWMMLLPLTLALWVVTDSWTARPDYLAWFNRFAGDRPETVLAESDLDWGQDLLRLRNRLVELHVIHAGIGYFGSVPLEKADLPPYTELSETIPVTRGFVAVSVRYITLEYVKRGAYAWLKDHKPVERIGKSIYLYNFGE
ncbi:MAG TPA: glycosyltransferase family 39 protein [Bryobacteraceae bacterium]|nr:glycosyltransferase family 39 protein [Bryobacteraceae bacterium]